MIDSGRLSGNGVVCVVIERWCDLPASVIDSGRLSGNRVVCVVID